MKTHHQNKIVFILFISVSICFSQGLTIGSGTIFSLGSSTLSLPGNWNNGGTFNANNSTVIFNGTGTQTITNAGGETFNNLTVNKSNGDVVLANTLTVNGSITVSGGDIDVNGNTLELGPSALISESVGNTVKGNGTLHGTITLNAPSGVNPFGLGAVITSTANLGSSNIVRGHAEQGSGGSTSILRYYDITPTNNSGLDATLEFKYNESELNSKTESALELYKSTDGGTSWVSAGGTVNTSFNYITLTGINSFSRWTAGEQGAPLPVELVSFTATSQRLNTELKWTTATETNNHGFEIERRAEVNRSIEGKGSTGWIKTGFVEGKGTSNAPNEYLFTDRSPRAGNYTYRLKQMDNNGRVKYSQEIEVNVGAAPEVFALSQNYPNPFNPTTTIGFTLETSGLTKLKIYDAIGREVAALVNENLEAGMYHEVKFDASTLSSGIYFTRLEFDGKQIVKKMLLLK